MIKKQILANQLAAGMRFVHGGIWTMPELKIERIEQKPTRKKNASFSSIKRTRLRKYPVKSFRSELEKREKAADR